jgi:DeoR family deoxyribose operon repressor
VAKAGSAKAQRMERLQAELAQGRALHISAVAKLLDVSEMTVRRDIQQNPDKLGYLGGYVVPRGMFEPENSYTLDMAADQQRDAKRRACEAALRYVKAEETIFIDCGTTLIELVDLIPNDMPLTVVCYALNVAERLAHKPNVTLVMLGGVYYPASATFFGPEALATIASLGINVALLSAAGFDWARGATCAHFHEAEIKRKVMATASRNILVIDTSKVGRLRSVLFAESSSFDAVVTERSEDETSRRSTS